MKKVNQSNVSQISTVLNTTNNAFVEYSVNEIYDITEWFNNNWISPFAKSVALEIKDILDEYFDSIAVIFDELNTTIKNNVILNNESSEMQKIEYNEFKISGINTSNLQDLNYNLPDGKVGLAGQVSSVLYEFSIIQNMIDEILTMFMNAIVKCDLLEDGDLDDINYDLSCSKRKAIIGIDDLKLIIKNRYDNYIKHKLIF